MKYFFLPLILFSAICNAQTVHYELVTIISVGDNHIASADSIFFQRGKFDFSVEEIIQTSDFGELKYPILSASRENETMYFETTNKDHEYVMIGSDGYIGGAIRIAFLKEEQTLIYSYTIKCIE